MIRRLLFVLALMLSFVLPACSSNLNLIQQVVEGSGTLVTEEREVSGFSAIQINLQADLTLIQGSTEGLSIEADDNLMEVILTRVENGKIIVDTPPNTRVSPSRTVQLTFTFDDLHEIQILGTSAITGEALELDELAINFSGSGSARLTGTVDRQSIMILGRATVNNFELVSRTGTIDIRGNGDIEINATETLAITVAGRGEIRYMNDPRVTRNVSGQATITQAQ